jgi:purine-nucleoside phosphorylase
MNVRRRHALIAGSGLGSVPDGLDVEARVPFEGIDGVGSATVAGHRGEVLRCRSGAAECWIVLGRRHRYEGSATPVAALVAWLAGCGVTDLLVTSAAGSLRTTLRPGELVLLSAVLDLQSGPPARAASGPPPDGGRGARRPVLDRSLTDRVAAAAERAGVPLHRGVAACVDGPTFETPAEVAFLQGAGADVAAMSAAPEIGAACENGMRVACIGAVTNFGTGIGHATPGHDAVLSAAAAMSPPVGQVFMELIAE